MGTVGARAPEASLLVSRGVREGSQGRRPWEARWDNRDSHLSFRRFHLLSRDALCGKLQCQGGEPSPLLPYAVPAEATVHLDGWEVTCRSALMLSGAQLAFSDLGMVEPGTVCGPRMVSVGHPTSPA